ncbi:MAG TPA: hypothetical protein VIG24_02105 [Acidimicrobiia bacterium]
MSTVGELADRTLREFLRPPDDQPVVLTLTDSVISADTTFNYDDSTLAPDEEELVAPGVIIEVGIEQCRVTDVDYDANTLTVIRGVNGTSPAAHAIGAEVTVSPAFTRGAVVEAIYDNVVGLYPSLWHLATEELTVSAGPVEVPAELITPVRAIWQPGGTRWSNAPVPDLLDPFPPSDTGKAVQFYAIPPDYKVHLTYRSKFARPSQQSDDLNNFGVEQEWERIVAIGAAAQVVALRPSDDLTVEYITQQLEREAAPPGTANDVRNSLLVLRDLWLREASAALRADQSQAVLYNPTIRR